MRQQWLARAGTDSLVLVFGGWALGATPFAGLTGARDVLLLDDYTSLDNRLPELAQYDRVALLAFSFGVAAAAHWLSLTGFRPARLVAVGGTLSPADAGTGIAPAMIRATADNLSAESFRGFCRRAGLGGAPPPLDIASARTELYAVIDRGPAPEQAFDRIWIPRRDRIFPVPAQDLAWLSQKAAIRYVPAPHVPFRKGQSWSEWLA